MSILGPFNNVPTGATYVMQSTGVNGDLVLAPINFLASGISTGATQGNTSLQRYFLIMGG